MALETRGGHVTQGLRFFLGVNGMYCFILKNVFPAFPMLKQLPRANPHLFFVFTIDSIL